MPRYRNMVVRVYSYATDELQKILDEYGDAGFQLVNAVLGKYKYNLDIMYLFFSKKLDDEPEENSEFTEKNYGI